MTSPKPRAGEKLDRRTVKIMRRKPWIRQVSRSLCWPDLHGADDVEGRVLLKLVSTSDELANRALDSPGYLWVLIRNVRNDYYQEEGEQRGLREKIKPALDALEFDRDDLSDPCEAATHEPEFSLADISAEDFDWIVAQSRLVARHIEVLDHWRAGLKTAQIAQLMGLSAESVTNYKGRIKRELKPLVKAFLDGKRRAV